MYTPSSFRVTDHETIRDFVSAYGFGIVITTDEGGAIHTTHTPMLLAEDATELRGHVARANPQWRDWTVGARARALFDGPHAYVSPRDYVSEFNVPTWNYTSVVVDGRVTILEDRDKRRAIVGDLARKYETVRDDPWVFDPADARQDALLDQIVAFRIEVESITATFKLNQNKSADDRRSVAARLRERGATNEVAIADLMER